MNNTFKIHTFDQKKYQFKELIQNLYDEENLEKIHITKPDLLPNKILDFSNEAHTHFHKIFYKKLNDSWPNFFKIYNNFIKFEITKLIDEPFIYQYTPSFRVQLPNDQAIHKWHYDSDKDHNHPDGEINFCIAITEMKNTTAIWAETKPGKKNFQPMEINYGEFYNFNGNKCTHGNKKNISNKVRISLDFRVLPKSKYKENYSKTSVANKKKFIIGEYYREL